MVLALPLPSAGQIASRFSVEPFAGAFRLDDGDLSRFGVEVDSGLALGGRLAYAVHPRFSVAANYAWLPLEARAVGLPGAPSLDAAAHLLYGSIEATVVSFADDRGSVSGTVGVGSVTMRDERDNSFTNLLVGIGLAARWRVSSRIRPRVDVRDYLHFCGKSEPGRVTGCVEDTVLDHLLLSAGVEVHF